MSDQKLWKIGLGTPGKIQYPDGYIHVVATSLEDAVRVVMQWEEDTMDEADPQLRSVVSVELVSTVILVDERISN